MFTTEYTGCTEYAQRAAMKFLTDKMRENLAIENSEMANQRLFIDIDRYKFFGAASFIFIFSVNLCGTLRPLW